MTTIAYKQGILAADGLITMPGGVAGFNAIKIGMHNNILWSASGDAGWCKYFVDWCYNGLPGHFREPPNDATGGTIYLPDDSLVQCHSHGYEYRAGLPFWADGSGADYAMGAMEVGATPEQAVQVAVKWDHHSGGRIVVLDRTRKSRYLI